MIGIKNSIFYFNNNRVAALVLGLVVLINAVPATTVQSLEPSIVEFSSKAIDGENIYKVKITFPQGEGQGYEIVKIEDYGLNITKILVQPISTGQYDIRVKIDVEGVPITGWELYYKDDLRSTSKFWIKERTETTKVFHLQISEAVLNGGLFYYIYIYDENGWTLIPFVLESVKETKKKNIILQASKDCYSSDKQIIDNAANFLVYQIYSF
jgi:hypothetical protein